MSLPPILSRQRRRQHQRKRLLAERLESRHLLATLIVNSTMDAVDADPGDGVCEISVGGPCTLRAAVQEANRFDSASGPHQINLPAGTYTLSITGIDDLQSLTGDLDFNGNVILQGAGATETVIDADGIDRVIDVGNDSLTIRGVTIRGGVILDDEDPVEGSGGGIRNEADLTLIDSVVTGNVATVGSGLANYNGTMRIIRSVISGNGGIDSVRGGGVANDANYDPAFLEITDSTITGNRADTGGGVINLSQDGVATTSIHRSTLSGNTAQNGGALSNRAVMLYDPTAANVTIVGSTLSGNTASVSGGGIRNETNDGGIASVDVRGSTVATNEATSGDGGGILSVAGSGASVRLQSVIVSDNVAGGLGPDLSAANVDAAFNLIETPSGHTITDGQNNNIVGQDPLLAPLQDNGGPTQTHSLLTDSPAIDHGSNADSQASDQRGSAFVRTVDDPSIANASDGTDIGSVEVGQVASTLDFGDAPESLTVGNRFRRYPTRLASDGARHQITEDGPFLGSVSADAETDGLVTSTATGDDLVGTDDEDGVDTDPIILTPGQALTGLTLSHHGGDAGALLNAWIDLNLDGDWDDPGEQVLADVFVPSGAATTPLDNVTIPLSTPSGTTFVRVRISTQSGLTPRGEASDGEVEDFAAAVGIAPPQFADLSLTHRVSDPNPTLGQDVTFTITLNNAGPDPASNIEVTSFLPFDLVFTSSTLTQGEYDDLDGLWFVDDLASGATAVLTVTATVDSTDTITHTAEVTASDQNDPDSTPGNGISGEDDQESVSVGTCLTSGPIQVGTNQLSYSCATPGGIVAFVRGSERGEFTFAAYNTTVDIADAVEVALAIADATGTAVAMIDIGDDEIDQTNLVQAFEMLPGSAKSNTLSLEATVQMLRTATVGSGGLALQRAVLPALVDAAIGHWESVGLAASEIVKMHRAHVSISDLPGNAIGRSVGNTVLLDVDAAGHGWFVDGTPADDREFTANVDGAAIDRVDALTALIHEFGHLIGLEEVSDSNHVMHGVLGRGERRLPTTNTNRLAASDVNGDGAVSAADVLVVINSLHRQSVSAAPGPSVWVGDANDSSFLDANGDYRVSALDALLVINELGRGRGLIVGEAVHPIVTSTDSKSLTFETRVGILDSTIDVDPPNSVVDSSPFPQVNWRRRIVPVTPSSASPKNDTHDAKAGPQNATESQLESNPAL